MILRNASFVAPGAGVANNPIPVAADESAVRVHVVRAEGGESLDARLNHLTPVEIKLLTTAPLRFGERVRLSLSESDECCQIDAEVKLIQKQAATDWLVTLAVIAGAQGAAFDALVAQGHAERRQSPRYASDIYAVVRWECRHEECEASLVDISSEGCRLFVEELHEEALRMLITIQDQDQDGVVVKAVKKWQRKIFEAWEIGCEFEGELNRKWVERISRSIGKEPPPSLSMLDRILGWFAKK